jgi:hypothetical protein
LRFQANGFGPARQARRVFGTASQVFGVAHRFAFSSLPVRESGAANSVVVLADIRDVANVSHLALIAGTDGSIVAYRGIDMGADALSGEVIGRSDPCFAPGGYHHLEAMGKIANAGGFLEVRVNEQTVLNLTGIDTQVTANAAAAQWAFGRTGGNNTLNSPYNAAATIDFDDPFCWNDNANDPTNTVVNWVGDKGAYWLPAASDTATSELSVFNSATAYGAINDVPPSGTSYLHTALAEARTIVGLSAMPGNIAEVIALMPLLYARKEESGSVLYRGGLISGAAETYGPEDNPSTEYAYLRPGPKTIDPATGAPWANSAAPKLLIERVA